MSFSNQFTHWGNISCQKHVTSRAMSGKLMVESKWVVIAYSKWFKSLSLIFFPGADCIVQNVLNKLFFTDMLLMFNLLMSVFDFAHMFLYCFLYPNHPQAYYLWLNQDTIYLLHILKFYYLDLLKLYHIYDFAD